MKKGSAHKFNTKLIITIIILLVFNCVVPKISNADVLGFLFSPVTFILSMVGDLLNDMIYTSLTYTGGLAFLPGGDNEAYVENLLRF